jgi:hypothetical protein
MLQGPLAVAHRDANVVTEKPRDSRTSCCWWNNRGTDELQLRGNATHHDCSLLYYIVRDKLNGCLVTGRSLLVTAVVCRVSRGEISNESRKCKNDVIPWLKEHPILAVSLLLMARQQSTVHTVVRRTVHTSTCFTVHKEIFLRTEWLEDHK